MAKYTKIFETTHSVYNKAGVVVQNGSHIMVAETETEARQKLFHLMGGDRDDIVKIEIHDVKVLHGHVVA